MGCLRPGGGGPPPACQLTGQGLTPGHPAVRQVPGRRAGFPAGPPRYAFRLEIVPRMRVRVSVDLGIYEFNRTVGPYNIDFLSIGQGFQVGHHVGTVPRLIYRM